jgi:hypothetical protein
MAAQRVGQASTSAGGVLMTIVLKSSPDAPASLQVDTYRNVSGQVATALRERLAELQELHAKAMGLRMKLAES